MSPPREADFRRHIRAGDTVVWGHAGAEPTALISQFLSQRHTLGGPVNVFLTGVCFSETVRPEHADLLRFAGIGGLGTHRRLTEAGRLDVLPCRYADLPRLIARGELKVDVAMVIGTPPGPDGLVSLGPTVAVLPEVLRAARVRYLEINPHVPFIGGDALVRVEEFDEVIYSDQPLVTMPGSARPPSGVTERICRHIAGLIGDGSTIQLGIGSVGLALPTFLRDRRDLGIHSAILTEPLVELIEAGVASGSRKERDAGLAVAGELLGSEKLYRYADHNDAVALRRSSTLLDSGVLAEFGRLVSINSALQVDLTGQVNAETMDGLHVGAVGGQVDFVRAASASTDGLSIIALPATAGDRSRIVPLLDSGVVTTPRAEVDAVVTEYGVARLRGLPINQRAAALAGIAHPDHRADLRARAVC
jgi:acetyl-CoA hydrolase